MSCNKFRQLVNNIYQIGGGGLGVLGRCFDKWKAFLKFYKHFEKFFENLTRPTSKKF
jgi:hypothetical protein